MRTALVRLLFVVVLVLPAPLLAQEPGGGGPVPISLDDAVRHAVANSPQVVQTAGQARVSRAQFRTSLAAFLPQVGFSQFTSHSVGQQYNQGLLYTTSGWGNSQGYGAGMTLFDGGQNFLNYRSAKASLDASEQAQIVQRFTIALSAKQQYFAVLASREAIAAAEQQLKEADEQMAVTNAQYAGGAKSRADSLASAVAVGQARVALVSAQGSLVTANTALTRLVGGTSEVTAVAADTGLVPTINLDSAALINLALHGPGVVQAEHQVDANHSSWWASIGAYLPRLSVNYSSGSSWQNKHFILGGGSLNSSTSLSYSLSYDLFDGFSREARVVQASVNRDNARAQLRDARLAARENISQYLAQFRTAQTKIELQALSIESGLENVAAKDAQYRAGAVSLVDVLIAQSALATARQGLIQARLDARTAKAQIEALIGKDVE